MKIYTSYFGNLKNIPLILTPISIAGKKPDWFEGKEYKSLAPKYWFFQQYKSGEISDQIYTFYYQQEVLRKLNPVIVREQLASLSKNSDIVLLCYEKPLEFCHRHLAARWLGEDVDEFCIQFGKFNEENAHCISCNRKDSQVYHECKRRKNR